MFLAASNELGIPDGFESPHQIPNVKTEGIQTCNDHSQHSVSFQKFEVLNPMTQYQNQVNDNNHFSPNFAFE